MSARPPRRAILVALEGIDGAGKSTLARSLARAWRRRGLRVARWREPTDRALGERAQRLARRDPQGAAELFTLDRIYARPRLDRLLDSADVVLADRSYFSTLAYQGSALRPPERRALERVQRSVARAPDYVVWLRLAPAQAIDRLRGRGHRSPLERSATLTRVDRAYRGFSRRPGWIVIDAGAPRAALAGAVDRRIRPSRRRRRSRA